MILSKKQKDIMEEKDDLNTKENKIYLEYLGELTDLEIKEIQEKL